MNEIKKFQDSSYLKNEQYQNSGNLNARASLHKRFRTAAIPWHQWVFEQLKLQPGSRVLECGCGPGWLWRENVNNIPPNCQLTLTDLSSGMVADAEMALKGSGHDFHFETADIQNLPFSDDAFDVVIANHMLYHVPDFTRAMMEVRRVLREDGRFFAATNGRNHLRELWELGRQLLAEIPEENRPLIEAWSLTFSLENGTEQLTPFFAKVTIAWYEDSLFVTEAEPIFAYLASSAKVSEIPEENRQRMVALLRQKIAQSGGITIQKETGMFRASL